MILLNFILYPKNKILFFCYNIIYKNYSNDPINSANFCLL